MERNDMEMKDEEEEKKGKIKGETEEKGAAEDGRKRKQRYNIRQPLEHNNTERDEY